MKKLFVILMLFATVAFATPFKMSMLDGGNVLYVQKHPQKAGYTIVTVQLANNDIYDEGSLARFSEQANLVASLRSASFERPS